MAIYTFISSIDSKREIVSVYCWHGKNRKDILRECTPENRYITTRACQSKAIRQMFTAFVNQRQWARRMSEDRDPVREKAMEKLQLLSVKVDTLILEDLCRAIVHAEDDIKTMYPGEQSRQYHWKKDISDLVEFCRKIMWAKHKDIGLKHSA